MTSVAHETGLSRELLVLLDTHEIRFEIIDGSLIVNPPPTFSHEDFAAALLVLLRPASPPDIAVLGSGFKYFYDGRIGNTANHTMADITVVRRTDVEEQGTINPPLLVVEVQSPSTQSRDLRDKRDIYERTGVQTYLLLHPTLRTLTVLELQDGRYVEMARVQGPASVDLIRPFTVTLDLSKVWQPET